MLCVWYAKLLQSCPAICDPMDYSHQTLLFMRFPRQEYWSGLPCPPSRDLPDPGIKAKSLTMSPALADVFFTTSAPWEAPCLISNN